MSFQILYQDEAVPSNLLWHTCGKLLNLKLDDNAAMKIARLVREHIDVHFSFRVFDVNW